MTASAAASGLKVDRLMVIHRIRKRENRPGIVPGAVYVAIPGGINRMPTAASRRDEDFAFDRVPESPLS
jgi:hypothetical protein